MFALADNLTSITHMFVCVKLAAIIFNQALSTMPKKCKGLIAVTKRGLKNSFALLYFSALSLNTWKALTAT